MNKVVVVGACGHVGLPFCLSLAAAGYDVWGLDINQDLVDRVNLGEFPYIEMAGEETLNEYIGKNLKFTTEKTCMWDADYIAIMIGTPVDSEGNARTDDILRFVADDLATNVGRASDPLIILRSTVAPGTTKVVSDAICDALGRALLVTFCPERVAQGYSLVEAKKFPQLVGVLHEGDFGDQAFERANRFFSKFIDNECIRLTATEAEIGKLMTNMYRYVNFALANEFYMIGDKYGVDTHKITDAINKDYPRMNLPKPGPNVGGPCLFKDGKFLLDEVPYVELIQSAFIINEGMPGFIWSKIKEKTLELDMFGLNKRPSVHSPISRVLIMGTTFKADSDDERNSLSFKMAKILKKNGVEYDFYDLYSSHEKNIYYNDENGPIDYSKYDAFIVMTPHWSFTDFLTKQINGIVYTTVPRDHAIIVDIWKLFPESKRTISGIYTYGEVK